MFQHQESNNQNVVLKSVNLKTTGLYRCEVSAEAPSFSSAQKEGYLQVIGKYKRIYFFLIFKTWNRYTMHDYLISKFPFKKYENCYFENSFKIRNKLFSVVKNLLFISRIRT